MAYFTNTQMELLQRVTFLRQMVHEQTFTDEPCPLLDHQLNRMNVFVDELSTAIRKLRESMAPKR